MVSVAASEVRSKSMMQRPSSGCVSREYLWVERGIERGFPRDLNGIVGAM